MDGYRRSETGVSRAVVVLSLAGVVALGAVAVVLASWLPWGDTETTVASGIGAEASGESISAQGFTIVTDGGTAATLVGTLLVERGDADRLVDVQVDTEVGPATATLAEGPIDLPPEEPVRLARDDTVTMTSQHWRPGFFVELTLVFEDAAPLEFLVPVEPNTGPYAEIEVDAPSDGEIAPNP